MAFSSFHNPTMPFTGSIQGGLFDGKTITITGQVFPGADRFHVNLQCGSLANADIALHVNPRYDSYPGYVVVNTLQHSSWGAEERKQNSPIAAGSSFTLAITVRHDGYELNVNGCHFMKYGHRIPFQRVDTISIAGKVGVFTIAFQGSMFPPHQHFPSYPGFAAYPLFPQPSYPGFPAQPALPSSVPAVPYLGVISGGIHPGKTITIQGVVSPNAERFMVNLSFCLGIALHYNPRFNENTVVHNTKLREKWGKEERLGVMPFQRGQPFVLTICCEAHSFRIVVNGNHTHSYNHRYTQFHEINILEVNGDISLSSILN